jgi:hypothetical protein
LADPDWRRSCLTKIMTQIAFRFIDLAVVTLILSALT